MEAPPQSQAAKNGEVSAKFTFSEVFDEKTTQQQVFTQTAAPLIDSFFEGYPALIFAYGITGSGKTHTIQGNAEDAGLIPRILAAVFEQLPMFEDLSVVVSFLEIYNEKIFDLLGGDSEKGKRPLKAQADRKGHVSVVGLREVTVTSYEEAMTVMQQGSKQRASAETNLNHQSSRSHAVFSIKLLHNNKQRDLYSKLSIVDLAGSERMARTQNQGDRFKESVRINTSLLILGRCLQALRWNQQHPNSRKQRVPFRESAITRLFKHSLTGWGYTAMIATINPTQAEYDENSHALKYAAVAQDILLATMIDNKHKPKPLPPMESDLLSLDESQTIEIEVSPEVGELIESKDAEIDSLLDQVFELKQHLIQLEERHSQLESEVRDEMCDEMMEQMKEMEQAFNQRLQNEKQTTEFKFMKKLELWKRELLQRIGVANESELKDADADAESIVRMEVVKVEMQQKEAMLQSQLAALQEQLQSIQQHLKSTQETNSEKSRKITALNQQIAELECKYHNDITMLEQLANEMETQAKSAAADNDKMKAKMEKTTKANGKAMVNLSKEAKGKQAEIQQLNKENEELKKDNEKKEKQLRELKEEMQRQEKKEKQMKKQMKQQEVDSKELDEMKELIETLHEQKKKAENTAAELRGLLASEKESIKSKMQESEAELKAVEKREVSLMEKLSRQESKQSKLKNQIDQLKQQNQSLTEAIEELEEDAKTVIELNQQNQTLKEQLDAVQQQLAEEQSARQLKEKNSADEVAHFLDLLADLTKENKELKAQRMKAEEEEQRQLKERLQQTQQQQQQQQEDEEEAELTEPEPVEKKHRGKKAKKRESMKQTRRTKRQAAKKAEAAIEATVNAESSPVAMIAEPEPEPELSEPTFKTPEKQKRKSRKKNKKQSPQPLVSAKKTRRAHKQAIKVDSDDSDENDSHTPQTDKPKLTPKVAAMLKTIVKHKKPSKDESEKENEVNLNETLDADRTFYGIGTPKKKTRPGRRRLRENNKQWLALLSPARK